MRNFRSTLRWMVLLTIRNWKDRLDYLQFNSVSYKYKSCMEKNNKEKIPNCFSISAYLQHKYPKSKDSYTPKKIASALSNIWIGFKHQNPLLMERESYVHRNIIGYKLTPKGRELKTEKLYPIAAKNLNPKLKEEKEDLDDFTCGDCKRYEKEDCPFFGEDFDLGEDEEICEEFRAKTKTTKTDKNYDSEEVNTKFIDALSSIEKGTMIEKVFSITSVALNGKWFSSRDLFKHFKEDTNRSSIHYALRVLTEREFLLRDSSMGSRSTKWKSLYPSNGNGQQEEINEDRVIPNIGGLVYELFPYALNGKGPLTVKMLEKIVNLIFTNANLSPAFEDEKLIKKNEGFMEENNNLKVENLKLSSRLLKNELKLQSLKDSITGL